VSQPPNQPGPAPQPAPEKKSRKKLWIALAIVLLVIIAISSGNDDDKRSSVEATTAADTSVADAAAPEQPAEKAAGIGDAVRDGNFEFTVKSVKCGVAQVGENEFLREKAQGQFCLATVTVKNVKNEPQTLFDSNQKAFVGEAEYAVSSEGGLAANMDANGDSTSVWLQEINPGNSVTGVFVWDIPAGKKLTKLELHDSAFSGGVTVAL
jgi:hypothetical protein